MYLFLLSRTVLQNTLGLRLRPVFEIGFETSQSESHLDSLTMIFTYYRIVSNCGPGGQDQFSRGTHNYQNAKFKYI